ncbi:Coiled-coil domain containing 42 [Perkinsus olseni]|uniref:Coiled-coil domain containing 42 n=1 Tax=Perkinsus olseni TaxID=32597 RepID=A0A7J6MWM0_PEROL|nr:Coiled-coil domain containing 42 [Perkinsus olseni]
MQDVAPVGEGQGRAEHLAGGARVGSHSSSPVTQLLEKRREMYDVHDALEAQKEKYANEEQAFRKKEEQIRSRDMQLQHQLIKFNKFLQDNEGKRRRAEMRAGEESNQIKIKEAEIDDIERELEESRRMHRELQHEVGKNLRYEAYLELVKESSDDYSEIQDILTRYRTLEAANSDLRAIQSALDAQAEQMRIQLNTYNRQKAMEILEATNRAASLQTDLEDAEKLATKLDEEVKEASEQDAGLRLDLGQIVASVENLFKRCVSQRPQIQHGSSMLEEDEMDSSAGGNSVSPASRGSPNQARGALPSENEKAESEFQEYRKKTDRALKQLAIICSYMTDLRDITDQVKKEKKALQKHQQLTAAAHQPSIPEAEIIHSFGPLEASGSSEDSRTAATAGLQSSGSKTISEQ